MYGKDSYKQFRYFTITKAPGTDKNKILMDTGTRLPKRSLKPNPVELPDKLGLNGRTNHFEPLLLTFEAKRA